MTLPPQPADWPPLTGAAALLAPALLDWAARDDPACPRVCLVTGARATGKSHLLAWLVAGSDSHPATTVHATVPARGHIAQTLSWELGRQLGYGPTDPGRLLERVAADPRPLRIVIPDLHLAGRGTGDPPSAAPQRIVAELLAQLLALPQVRAAIELDRPDLFEAVGPLVLALPVDAPAHPRPAPEAVEPPESGPPGMGWRAATAAARERALDLAVSEGTASQLLADPDYLAHGSALAITAALTDRRIAVPRGLRATWAAAGPILSSGELSDPERAAVLHSAALATDPRLAEYLRPLAEQHVWTAQWSRADLRTTGLALAERGLLIIDGAGRLGLYRPTDGTVVARITGNPHQRPTGLAVIGSGQALGVDSDGRLQLLAVPAAGTDEAPGESALHQALGRHAAAVLAGAAARVTAVASDSGSVAVGDAEGWFRLWPAGHPSFGAQRPHQVPVTAIACLGWPEAGNGLRLVFTGGADGTVRLWDSATGRSMPDAVERRNALPTALAAAHTAVGPVLAVAWSDRRLHLWRPADGRSTAVPSVRDIDSLALSPEGLLICGGPQGTGALRIDLAAL